MRCHTRRDFLFRGALGAAALAGSPPASFGAVKEYRRGGMVYRKLGQTDLYVSLLSFGSHTDPAYKIHGKGRNTLNAEGQARRDRLLARAFDLGVNVVDTYENEGQAEPMARLVKSRRDKVLISFCRNLPMFVGENIDNAARLYGHVDLYRIYVGDGAAVDSKVLEDWDIVRKAKEAGKLRAIGIATHSERMMLSALDQLEGMDYLFLPYNFIHARADYSEFLPKAIRKGIGLIAMKPLAAGSILRLDPRANQTAKPENERIQLYQSRNRSILPAVVTELTKSLNRLPDETLCQAALRYVYSRPFLSCTLPGMFEDYFLDENHAALQRSLTLSQEEKVALHNARRLAALSGDRWLPRHYRWLDSRWHA
ncbi:MAG: aldo/keto reductase [Bryobacterales bacterium]|nr:aldo/keto reductase [Bryobacterales bacterium]